MLQAEAGTSLTALGHRALNRLAAVALPVAQPVLRIALALLLALSATVAACGSDRGSDTNASGSPATTGTTTLSQRRFRIRLGCTSGRRRR